ncbi:uncharacterized protein LOC142771985 isoform X1 [Rhipicephalus microplus]|uniref:uncharacterized protein LOC142771985 isoform X1 n=1 Tax=Rhipicephalus microplus TaxID=6941 RepID=UPI003F6A86DB
MTANPFVFIVQLVATLLLIPAECDVLGWQAAINALQPAVLLAANVSTAHAHLSDIWTTPPSSTAVGALAGLDGGAMALQAIHWSIKPDRNHPDAIGHGSITGMTANPFVFIVQCNQGCRSSRVFLDCLHFLCIVQSSRPPGASSNRAPPLAT